MCVGSHTAGTWFSSQWRPDGQFETDRPVRCTRDACAPDIGADRGGGGPEERYVREWLGANPVSEDSSAIQVSLSDVVCGDLLDTS
jgi:hypothetical protein